MCVRSLYVSVGGDIMMSLLHCLRAGTPCHHNAGDGTDLTQGHARLNGAPPNSALPSTIVARILEETELGKGRRTHSQQTEPDPMRRT